jgi:hypothetical protein
MASITACKYVRSAIEQFDDRDVDVPKFIWFGRPNTFLGFGRMDPKVRRESCDSPYRLDARLIHL